VIGFSGVLYSGRSASRQPVQVEVDGATMTITGDGDPRTIALNDVRADAPVAGVPRRLALPGGAVVETEAAVAVESAWPTRSTLERFAFSLESSVTAATAAVFVIALLVGLLVWVVLPAAADPVARAMDPRVEKVLGAQAQAALDKGWLRTSLLPAERQQEINAKFAAFAGESAGGATLAFRRMGAPNALALPGGTIVLTDEMVSFTRNDDELMAVLAHELGHVQSRHALRLVLQQSGLAVLATVIAGDAAGMTILAIALPSALVNARYSRDFEVEADDYAIALLAKNGRPPQAFADVLRRFANDERTTGPRDPLWRYLSSHPALEERIQRAEAAR
jgi:Zn-dependent protease with chaperone function